MYQDNGSTLIFDTNNGEYWSFTYDIFNRLVKVSKSAAGTANAQTVAEYTYDAENLRIRKSSAKNGDTWYVYGLSGEVLYEETAKDTTSYVYVNGRHFAMVETDTTTNTSATYFYSLDQVGSTVMVTDTAGKVVWQNEATPFGEWSGEVGVMHLKGKFTGKDFDDDINLYYYNARWMDPETGRFISEDPAQDGGNWYAYGANNPMVNIDPSGMMLESTTTSSSEGAYYHMTLDEPVVDVAKDPKMADYTHKRADQRAEQIIAENFDEEFRLNLKNSLRKTKNGSVRVYSSEFGIVSMDRKLAEEFLKSGMTIFDFAQLKQLAIWTPEGDQIARFDYAKYRDYNNEVGPNLDLMLDFFAVKGAFQFGKALLAKIVEKRALNAAMDAAFREGKLVNHFAKHGAEFGYKTEADYLKGANDLLKLKNGENIIEYKTAEGTLFKYNKATNELVILSKDGKTIETFLKPERGLDYVVDQMKKY